MNEGKRLHEHKLQNCAFCGNLITGNRWEALESHFDEESEKLRKRIELLLTKVEAEISLVSNCLPINKNAFYSRFHKNLDRFRSVREHILGQYIKSLEQLRQQLMARANDIINAGTFVKPFDFSERLINAFDFFESIRNLSNDYTGKLDRDQGNAKTSLRLKEVHDFVATIQYEKELKNQ